MTTFNLIQTHLVWESAAQNQRELQARLDVIPEGQVAVMPEMFSTGFSMASSRLAEPMNGATVTWMQQLAAARKITICGSLIISEAGNFYNRFLWVRPDGEIIHYDKRHLFRMANEHSFYAPGKTRQLVTADDFIICPQVCYDLRFPVWSRNVTKSAAKDVSGSAAGDTTRSLDKGGFDILIYVANWPAARRDQWLALLRARAIENLCFVIGVNRIGTDGNGVVYAGDSCAFDYRGDEICNLGKQNRSVAFTPDVESLRTYRTGFPAHLDADEFDLC